MIRNEKQYKITRAHLKKFEEALLERQAISAPEGVEAGMWELEQDALKSQIEDLRQEVLAYEKLKAGEVEELELSSLADLANSLIQARIAQGLTQKELAEKLQVKEQQVQKDEANQYETASLSRLRHIAEVLGLEFEGQVRLPVRH